MTAASVLKPRSVTLPRSSDRAARPVYLKLLEAVGRADHHGVGWDGTLYRPGAVVPSEDLGDGPVVVLECAGSLEKYRKGRYPEVLWVLWQWDWIDRRWHELARARATGWEWTVVLREPALRALHPRPQMEDILRRGRDLSDELLRVIEARLELEPADTRAMVLNEIYHQVAGRLAAA